jgi:hypothetical protein
MTFSSAEIVAPVVEMVVPVAEVVRVKTVAAKTTVVKMQVRQPPVTRKFRHHQTVAATDPLQAEPPPTALASGVATDPVLVILASIRRRASSNV